MFEEFVPVKASYKSFWARYFFRCDPVRVQQAWEFQQELDNRVFEARLRATGEIVALPGRIVNGVVLQPVSFLARRFVSLLSGVFAITGLQAESNHGQQRQQQPSHKQMEDLQMEINASNEQISSLRQNLDVARKELKLSEYASRSLSVQLAVTKAALGKRKLEAKTLESEIQEIHIISADDTSNTASCTEISGLEEPSRNREEDNIPLLLLGASLEVETESNSRSDDTLRTYTEMLESAFIVEGSCVDDSEDNNSSTDGWKHDKQFYDSDLALLTM